MKRRFAAAREDGGAGQERQSLPTWHCSGLLSLEPGTEAPEEDLLRNFEMIVASRTASLRGWFAERAARRHDVSPRTVAVARQALITAEGLVRQQELVIKTAMTRRGLANPAIRDARVVPMTAIPVVDHGPHQSIEELLATALRNRPDLAHAAIQVKNAEISLQGALNALLPQVDLVGTLANGGLAGTVNPTAPVPPGLDLRPGGYGTVLDQILRRNYPSYSIGVQLTLPLRNRVAQADAVRDQLQLRQAQVRRQQLEDQVRLEVANAYVSLEQTQAAYEAAVPSRVLQEQSVDVEQQKFAAGLSTNYLVIQFQTYLAQARSTEVAAKGAYAKARTALERATGRILDAHHVSFDEAYHGQIARPSDPIP